MNLPKSPFQRLVDDLYVASRLQNERVIFVKALPHVERDLQRAEGHGRIDGLIAAAAMQASLRRLLDADHARKLRPGDLKRASAAIELGRSIPGDIVARIEGRERAADAS